MVAINWVGHVLCLFVVLRSAWIVSPSTYNIDDSQGYGRTFDGVGGISGGGATSRLLVNYPQQQRSEILDFLFKPGYGASLQILKGKSNPGYEWWLMLEAKKRNPDILLYGLPWAFPGWVGQGTDSPYTNISVTADYILRWMKGAKQHYNLTIDYIGIWNEKAYNIDYILMLRKMLDDSGFSHTRIVASDNKWDIAEDILNNADLAKAVDFIGVHYPGTLSSASAERTGKQLWSSEDYSTFNDNTGGGCWARILNQNYVNGNMTATISWNLIAAYYSGLSYSRTGLMTAMEPWSGHYVVESPIWMTAHTTQFTKPGWKYLKHGTGVGKLDKGGSYVTFSDEAGQLTTVIESMSHEHSICIRPFLPDYKVEKQNITFQLKGSFSKIKTLDVWYSKLTFDGLPSTFFTKLTPVPVTNGSIQVELGIDEVITLTTVSSGAKGTAPQPPPSKPFPLPYRESFESYSENGEPNNFAQQTGSFEVLATGDGNHSKILRQMVLEDPIDWCPFINLAFPINVIGSVEWTDIYVEVEARTAEVNGSDSVFVANRVDQGGCQTFGAHGYFFFLFPKEQRYELSNDLSRAMSIKSGDAPASPEWNKLGLSVSKGVVTGSLNGKVLFNITTSNKPTAGFAAIGSGSYGISDFDNFMVTNSDSSDKQNSDHTLYFKPYKRYIRP